jgi:hypothetical protein
MLGFEISDLKAEGDTAESLEVGFETSDLRGGGGVSIFEF